MTNRDLFFAIGSIDEKWIKEADTNVSIIKKNKIVKRAISIAACLVLIVAAVMVWQGGNNASPPASDKGKNTPGVTEPTACPTENDSSENKPQTTAAKTDIQSGDKTDTESDDKTDQIGFFNIPALPQNRTITVTGEKITDDEASAYLNKNRDSIISSLSASGTNTKNANFSQKGYCHVGFDGKAGENLTVRENYRDYLLYSGERLVAIITLVKENGSISSNPMFGGAWFEAYNKFLNSHKGEELVFVYSGSTELIITPDNTVYAPVLSPNGYDASVFLKGADNPYQLFYNSANVYVP